LLHFCSEPSQLSKLDSRATEPQDHYNLGTNATLAEEVVEVKVAEVVPLAVETKVAEVVAVAQEKKEKMIKTGVTKVDGNKKMKEKEERDGKTKVEKTKVNG